MVKVHVHVGVARGGAQLVFTCCADMHMRGVCNVQPIQRPKPVNGGHNEGEA